MHVVKMFFDLDQLKIFSKKCSKSNLLLIFINYTKSTGFFKINLFLLVIDQKKILTKSIFAA